MRRTALLLMLGITLSAGSMAAQTTLPTDPGLYVRTSSHFTKILGQIVTFERTGSLVASGLTGGIVSRKGNVQLLGAHAQTVTGTKPAFYFIPAKQEADTGGSAGDLVLIRLLIPPQPGDRRQFETGAQGYGRASTGISITHQIQLLRSEVTPGIYKLTPADSLHRGEYAFYLARGEGMAPYVYDFSVEGDVKIGLSDKSRVPVADILKTAGKATDCEDVIWVTEEGAPFTAAEVRSAGALPGNATPFDYRLEVRKSARDFALTLFNPDGAVVHETEANTLDNALAPMCHVMDSDVATKSNDKIEDKVSTPAPKSDLSTVSSSTVTISVSSNPDGADVFTDGAFVGNAPAMLKLTPGKHTIKLALGGYKDWSREVTTLAGSEVHLTASLERQTP